MLKKIDLKDLSINPFTLLNTDWALLMAGDKNSFNSMTVSWGGMGVLWRKNVTTVYVRQSRYTKEFMDNSDFYTLTFLKDDFKEQLSLLGTKSGRDIDKMNVEGLNLIDIENGFAYEESKLVFVCKKLFKNDLKESQFLVDNLFNECYSDPEDIHTMYVGEIVDCYISE
ncbi:flavin reductase [Peptacetobacter sp.]|uniref:flavin reductase n=1 Tax=Peptacetobacter sp. TaxID=2991975 RepID=UPI002623D78F|nr:flavin reductase family protein [Peptacetobacter sp.]